MGDSLTQQGWYPNDVDTLLSIGWDIINKGVPGDTTAAMLARFSDDIVNYKYGSYVVILGGTNDVLSQTALTIHKNVI